MSTTLLVQVCLQLLLWDSTNRGSLMIMLRWSDGCAWFASYLYSSYLFLFDGWWLIRQLHSYVQTVVDVLYTAVGTIQRRLKGGGGRGRLVYCSALFYPVEEEENRGGMGSEGVPLTPLFFPPCFSLFFLRALSVDRQDNKDGPHNYPFFLHSLIRVFWMFRCFIVLALPRCILSPIYPLSVKRKKMKMTTKMTSGCGDNDDDGRYLLVDTDEKNYTHTHSHTRTKNKREGRYSFSCSLPTSFLPSFPPFGSRSSFLYLSIE